ncbi:MAG: serine protease [Nitrospirae bacterium YQR-1]
MLSNEKISRLAALIMVFFLFVTFVEAFSVPPSQLLSTTPKKTDPHIKTLNYDIKILSSELLTVPIPTDKIGMLKSKSSNGTKLYQVSTHVDIPEAGKSMFTPYLRDLQTKDGLSSKRAAIYAKDAVFIRAHFKKIPANANLFVYGLQGQSSAYGPVEGDSSDAFWGPVVEGEILFLEIMGGEGTDAADLIVDKISYGFANPLSSATKSSALSCNVDVNCSSAAAATYKNAVALMYFEKSSGGYVCSGAMIADSAASNTNWFLTANHCISSNSEASSLIAYFGYRTSSCNGSAPSVSSTTQVSGAEYVTGKSASDGTDFTLLKLNSSPPSGTYYLGWTTDDISDTVVGIHYPAGSYERISEGSVSTGYTWSGINNNDFVTVSWNSGITEDGSSGSPLMLKSTGEVVGQLYGGQQNQTCSSSARLGVYGKFAKSYNYGLSTYLSSSSTYAGSTVTYNMPYLHTNSAAISYCWLSNTTTDTATATFTVMSNNSSSSPSQSAKTKTISIAGKKTALLTFTGKSIKSGSTSVDISGDISGTDVAYGLKIVLTISGSNATCETIGMSCFQGTTSPKRNLKGYTCRDANNHYDF